MIVSAFVLAFWAQPKGIKGAAGIAAWSAWSLVILALIVGHVVELRGWP